VELIIVKTQKKMDFILLAALSCFSKTEAQPNGSLDEAKENLLIYIDSKYGYSNVERFLQLMLFDKNGFIENKEDELKFEQKVIQYCKDNYIPQYCYENDGGHVTQLYQWFALEHVFNNFENIKKYGPEIN